MTSYLTVGDVDVADRNILVRSDLNVPWKTAGSPTISESGRLYPL